MQNSKIKKNRNMQNIMKIITINSSIFKKFLEAYAPRCTGIG